MTLSGKTRLFLMIVSGALTALCFAFHDVWFLCFFTLIPFFLVMLDESPCTARRFFLQVFAFAAAFYLVTLHWFYALTDFVTRSGASPFFAVLAMTGALLAAAALLALVTALVFLPFCWFRPVKPTAQALFLCFNYIVSEWLLSLMGDLAFPWARLGNFAAFSPWFIQSASLLGSLFVSLIILIVAAALALLIRRLIAERAFDRFAAGCLVAALAVFGGNSLYGAIRLSRPSVVGSTAEVLLVQGNIVKSSKWNLPIEDTLAIYFDLTEAGMTDQTRLVVWPESAVSVDLSRYPEVLAVLKNFAVARNVTFAFGTLDGEADIARPYNVLLTVTPDGAVSEPYYKRLLVPFGEFIPFESVLRFIADVFASRDVILSDTARGTEPRVFDSPVGRFSGVICYESIHPGLTAEGVAAGGDLILLISNDSWFGTSAALNEHFSHSILRAVENGRSVARCGNCGPTAVIDARGRVVGRLDDYTPAALRCDVDFIDTPTLYTAVGDIVVIPYFAMLLVCVLRRLPKRKRDSGATAPSGQD